MKQEYLDKCKELASNSNCKFVHFGAVIVDEYQNRIVGMGWNEALSPELCCLKDNLKGKVVGRNPGVCSAIHAEQMAIIDAIQSVHVLDDCVLYVAGWYPDGTPFSKGQNSFACTLCARWIKYTDIKKVVTVKREYTPDEALKGAIDDIVEKISK